MEKRLVLLLDSAFAGVILPNRMEVRVYYDDLCLAWSKVATFCLDGSQKTWDIELRGTSTRSWQAVLFSEANWILDGANAIYATNWQGKPRGPVSFFDDDIPKPIKEKMVYAEEKEDERN